MLERFKYAYWSLIPYNYRPGRLWYQLKCWVWHRYSTVKPRNLPHTWVDRCVLMPHAIFEILSDFVEGECGPDSPVEWYGDHPHLVEVDGKQVNVHDELQDLYSWWHDDYLKNKDTLRDEWYAHRELHVKDIFSKVADKEVLDWIKSVDKDVDSSDLEEHSVLYSSPEAEIENDRLFAVSTEKEKHYREELESRLHRVINIIPYMWT
jgi:hypothetical protein